MLMRNRTWLVVFTMLVVVVFGRNVRVADEATLLRVFLIDGVSLVSFGEPARVGDRIVFSMPTASTPTPPLQLISLPASRVDWDRTNRYADSARAARYLQTQAEADYAVLASDISQALKDLKQTTDPSRRLAIAEISRKRLAAWPESHFNYRAADVIQLLSLMDEAIADLRAASGVQQFNLSFSTSAAPAPVAETLLPAPTLKEAIEQLLTAARTVDTAADRSMLLRTALVSLDRDAAGLPAAWVARTRAETRASLRTEERVDRSYREMATWMLGIARWRAGRADAVGLERLPERIDRLDRGLGRKRPEVVQALLAAVEVELDSARRLREARDQFAGRAPALKGYQLAIAGPLERFTKWRPLLEAIKSSSISPELLIGLSASIAEVFEQASAVTPPDEFAVAHATLVSALQFAGGAARLSVEAVGTGNAARGRDASSAAAGSLMLGARATSDIEALLRPPQRLVQAASGQPSAIDEIPRAAGDSSGRVRERAGAAPAAVATPAAAARTLASARPQAVGSPRQPTVIAEEVASPTLLMRWRVGPRGLLQYSANGGAAWEQISTDVVVDLMAGASPSSSVCWVVGRAGTVLLTVDGRHFDRLPFPAAVDLTAVRATDARTAVVTAADGQAFSTSDGGSTWIPMQAFRPAPS